jgi:hypothetical protein
LFVPGLAVVIPYGALLFDSGCINDSLRWLTLVDVGSKRNCYEFRNKVVYRRKEKDAGEDEGRRRQDGGQRGGKVAYLHIEERFAG